MNHESPTRQTIITQPASSNVPQAPPLPVPKPLQRARDAAYRFMGYQSRNSDPTDLLNQDRFIQHAPRSRLASLGATQNATASHRTGLEINTIAVNEKGTHALIAGKEIFKTVRVEDGQCVEEVNLRTAIRSTPTHASGKPRQAYAIDVADVAWARGDCSDFVAAATSSGKIILYDLGHAGLQAAQLHEHYRQVHKITFNPHRGNLLLSGSQDGTVRLWDIRGARTQASTLQSKRKYSGQSDGVRDVKWSPTDGVDFAFGTDSGWIQRWDLRNLKAAKLKIPAHSLACNTIDWHCDGQHILSAGLDKMVRFWDFTLTRKQAVNWEIKTPFPVMNARWRPSCESSMRQDYGARICTQIVTSYSREHPQLHIWDLRRPHIPFRELVPYASAATDLSWHSQDLLWTVGREGVFLQTDIQHTPKTLDRRNVQAFAVAPTNDIQFAVQRRRQRRSARVFELPPSMPVSRQGSSLSVSPETSVLSRSWADDSLDNLFLSVPASKPQSHSSNKTPTNTNMSHTTVKLDDILLRRQSQRPLQATVRGYLPRSAEPHLFRYLAEHYTWTLSTNSSLDVAVVQDLERLLESNFVSAQGCGLTQTSQSWKILAFIVADHLRERVKSRADKQGVSEARLSKQSSRAQLSLFTKKMLADLTKSPQFTPASMRPVSAIAQQLGVVESTSNVPTPLARPVGHGRTSGIPHQHALPDPEGDESLLLPPSMASKEMMENRPKTALKQPLTSFNLQDLHKQQAQPSRLDRLDMIHNWSVQNREPLNLDPVKTDPVPIRPKLIKHDSDESFAFLGESSDSRGPSLTGSFDSGADRMVNLVAERPSRPKPANGHVEAVEAQIPSVNLIKFTPSSAEEMAPVSHENKLHADKHTRRRHSRAKSRSCTEPLDPHSDDEAADCEEQKPFTLVDMLKELLAYHTGVLGDAQTASHLITLLVPLLPPTHPLPDKHTERTVAVFAEMYSSMGMLPDDIAALVVKHLAHVVSVGLEPLQLESILLTYHEQLMSQRLFATAARLRKLAFPVFPAMYEPAVKDNSLHFSCASCGKAVSPSNDGNPLRCSRCEFDANPCPICWCVRSPGGQSLRFSACLLCGHSGHAKCLEGWFAEGEGACPSEGCLCDCTVGKWRDAKTRIVQKQLQRAARKHHLRVRSDEWKINESNAVAALGGLGAAAMNNPLSVVAQARSSA